MHGWDLARATGQRAAYDDRIVSDALAFSRARLPDLPAGHTPFAPPREAPADAPPLERLVALLGREP